MTADPPAPNEIFIPGGHGSAFPVHMGQFLQLVDVEGQQVADMVAFAAQDRREWLSTSHTRSATLRLDLRIGDQLESNWRRPMFRILHDDVGSHDVITQMCDERRYRIDYGVEGHRSCRTNFTEAYAPWGISEWEMPDPFNIFQNAPIHADRSFGNQIPPGKAGDSIVFEVLMDSIVGVSACPQDLNPCNGFKPTPILVRVLDRYQVDPDGR
jgi:uncharacterized protein YcgI (DUF1989 family)